MISESEYLEKVKMFYNTDERDFLFLIGFYYFN